MEMRDLTEKKLRSKYGYLPIKTKPLSRKIKDKLHCNFSCLKTFITRFIPILVWLPKYPFLRFIIGDVTSGMTTAIVRIPQGLAYGLLAGILPINGLYTGFFSPLVYSIFGTSRHISAGVFSIVSLMLGSALDKLDFDATLYFDTDRTVIATTPSISDMNTTTLSSPNVTGLSDVQNNSRYTDAQNLAIICSLTILIGIVLFLLGVCRLGIVSMFLSEPLVSAFTTGAAIYVVTAQLKFITGIRLSRRSGAFGLIKTYIELFSRITEIQWASVVLTLICLFILVPIKYVNRTYKEKLRSIPIPVELFIVVLGTAISGTSNLNDKYGIEIVGFIPSGMPSPIVPKPSLWPLLITDAVSIAVVIFAVSISMGKIFAKKHGYSIDPNQELLALGLCQMTCGFFRGHSGSGALARSTVQESSGGNTQVASLVSCAILLLVLLVIGPLFENLPVACLSCIILANLHGLLIQFKILPELWKLDIYDFAVWVLTFISVILLGVDLGLLAGLAFSLCCGGLRASKAEITILGELEGTDQYRNVQVYCDATQSRHIKIIQFSQSPTYANKSCLQHITPDFLSKTPRKTSTLLKSDGPNNYNHDESIETTLEEHSVTKIVIFDCSCWSIIDTVGMSTLKSVIKDLTSADMQVFLASVQNTVHEKIILCGIVSTDNTSVEIYPSVPCAVVAAKSCLAMVTEVDTSIA